MSQLFLLGRDWVCLLSLCWDWNVTVRGSEGGDSGSKVILWGASWARAPWGLQAQEVCAALQSGRMLLLLAPENSGESTSPRSEHVHIHIPNLRSQIPLVPLRAINVGHLVRLCSFIPLFSSAMLAVRHWTLVPEEDKGVHKHCLEDPLNLRVLRIEAFKEANKS